MNWKERLPDLLEIAKSAGAAILDIYESEDFGIETKGDDSPLTKADQAANTVICDGLTSLFPEIPIISEENKLLPFEDRKSFDYFWLVDPLDGTKEFIKRNGEFTVNIALVHKNHVIGGVVYTPVSDDLYHAFKGSGAFHEKDGHTEKMEAKQFSMFDSGLSVVCSRSHLNEATQDFVNKLKEPILVSKGSSLKFLILAGGKAELYPRLAPTMEWDTAAAQIILEESGGSVINQETGKPLTYNKEILRNPYFVAYASIQK